MKVGVYLNASKYQGGIYQYSVSFLEALSQLPLNQYFIFSNTNDVPEKFHKLKNFKIVESIPNKNARFKNLAMSTLINLLDRCNQSNLSTVLYGKLYSNVIDLIDEAGLDLIFFPTSENVSFLIKPPSVVAIHDLNHRIYPYLKELSAQGRFNNREFTYKNICKSSYKILVDSKIGKEDVINFYKVDGKKIVILPFLPPSYLQGNRKKKEMTELYKSLKLPQHYIFYPARFWPHKNHINLIKALSILRKKGIEINLVLSGSKEADFSTFEDMMKSVKELGLEGNVKYLGYIDDMQMAIVYRFSKALVMPTLFGPTNIPILEAWKIGTPVITSNIRGCREQVGSAGLLADPFDPEDIAKKIEQVYYNEKLREDLIKRGRERLSEWDFKSFKASVNEILEGFGESIINGQQTS